MENTLREGKVRELMNRSGIPRRYQGKTFSVFEILTYNQEAYTACVNYCDQWNQNLQENWSIMLFGDIGVGKTHLAAAVCHALIQDHLVNAVYANVLHTFEMARASFSQHKENPIGPLLNAQFLVLDDLGSERATPWAIEQLCHIIDYHYNEDLPVFATTNAGSWEGMLRMLTLELRGDPVSRSELTLPAQRIIDRLRDMTGESLLIHGQSYRGRL
jgi:DNA replication protein DnaC